MCNMVNTQTIHMTVDVFLTRERHAGEEDGLQGGEGAVVTPEYRRQSHAQGLRVSAELLRGAAVDASCHLSQDYDQS